MRHDPLIVRVTRCDPGVEKGEPVEYLARGVEPEVRSAVGRGLTVGAALDMLLAQLSRVAPSSGLSVIVDRAGRP